MFNCHAVCISNPFIVFGEIYDKIYNEYKTKMYTYNDETSQWKLIDCKYLNNKRGVSCIIRNSILD